MNIQQFEYIIALDTYRNHVKAAEHCHVTQPTLSMMVKRLEEELGMKIFDRSTQPLRPTPMGELVLAKVRHILSEIKDMKEFVQDDKESVVGHYRVGVIPTLAPYLLPRFVNTFLEAHPGIRFSVSEYQTHVILALLKEGRLDIGLLVTPLEEKSIREIPVFHEPILLYASESSPYYRKKKVKLSTLSTKDLWLLEEGHCFRGQVMNLCAAKEQHSQNQLSYQSGSFETLKAMVDNDIGYTLIPELCVSVKDKHVRRFDDPEPVREVSIVVHQRFSKELLLTKLRDAILKSLPGHFKKIEKYMKVRWN